MTTYYIYYVCPKKGDSFRAYFKGKLSSPKENYEYLGSCEVDERYFIVHPDEMIHVKVDEGVPYQRRDILEAARVARESDNIPLAGMLEDYARLKFNYVNQLLKRMKENFKWDTELHFPHLFKLKLRYEEARHKNS